MLNVGQNGKRGKFKKYITPQVDMDGGGGRKIISA